MTVLLDAPTPMWRVNCDTTACQCQSRLYLRTENAETAAQRAVDVYGWARDGERTYCRVHRGEAT